MKRNQSLIRELSKLVGVSLLLVRNDATLGARGLLAHRGQPVPVRASKMDRMLSRASIRVALAAALACAAVGCSDDGTGGVDKAGGTGEPVTLRMATAYHDLGDLPALAYFVNQVAEVSDGAVRIEIVGEWGDAAPNAEESVVRGVADGDADLGWAGSRVFDTLGVTEFQALAAPMLVDSYALEGTIIRSGITKEMMSGLDDVGVEGLGVLAEGLRKPFGVERPIVGPGDWKDITFATVASKTQAAAISALGAEPVELFGSGREEALDEGEIQGFEFSLYNYSRDPALQDKAPFVTANVNLWPLMSVVFGNPEGLSALSTEQRGWLEEAARDAADRSSTLVDTDAESVRNVCGGGPRFTVASAHELAALKKAFAPVYASFRKDPTTEMFIDKILALKDTVAPAAAVPSNEDCAGAAPGPGESGTGTAPAALNGTYRYKITLDAAQDASMVDDQDTYPIITTIYLEDGNLEGGCYGAEGGTYSVDGDRIAFHSSEYDYTTEVTFKQDEVGNLDLTPAPGTDPGDAFQCYSQEWTKIE
jgi:TRAP-type transport system periplasmic protein